MSNPESIPKLDHIPILAGTSNAQEWFRAMARTLKAQGVWGHVEGTNDPAHVWQASHPPVLTALSTNAQRTAASAWWIRDARAFDIIDRRLNPVTQSLMPTGDHVTARAVWLKLKSIYGRVDIHAQFNLRDRIAANHLKDHHDYIRFLGEFNTCRSQLLAMDIPYPENEAIHVLIRQLPHDDTWPQFKQHLSHFVQTWLEAEAEREEPSPPETLYNKVIARIEQESIRLESHSRRPDFAAVTTTVRKTSRNPTGAQCTNCNLNNHDFEHCFRKGGGAEGKWPGGSSAVAQPTPKPSVDIVAMATTFDTDDILHPGDYSC